MAVGAVLENARLKKQVTDILILKEADDDVGKLQCPHGGGAS